MLSTPDRRERQRRDVTGAPISGRNEGRHTAALAPGFWRESGKSREREGAGLGEIISKREGPEVENDLSNSGLTIGSALMHQRSEDTKKCRKSDAEDGTVQNADQSNSRKPKRRVGIRIRVLQQRTIEGFRSGGSR